MKAWMFLLAAALFVGPAACTRNQGQTPEQERPEGMLDQQQGQAPQEQQPQGGSAGEAQPGAQQQEQGQ